MKNPRSVAVYVDGGRGSSFVGLEFDGIWRALGLIFIEVLEEIPCLALEVL